jgi:hypothetical protein
MLKYEEGIVYLRQVLPIELGEREIRQPELRMWAVCLSQAIAGAVGLIRCDELKSYRSLDRYWLIRDKRQVVGSCNWICEMLGVSRAELVSFVWKNRHVLRRNPYRLRGISK